MTSAPTKSVARFLGDLLSDAEPPADPDVRIVSVRVCETASIVEVVASWRGHAPHTYTIDVRRDS